MCLPCSLAPLLYSLGPRAREGCYLPAAWGFPHPLRQPLPGQPGLDHLSADKIITPLSHSTSNRPGSGLLDPLLFLICTLNPAVSTSQDIATVYQIFPDEVLGSGQFGVVYGGKDATGLVQRPPGDSQVPFPIGKISGLLGCYQ